MTLVTGCPVALLRASASATTGGGHIMRCLALGEKLANLGWQVSIAVGAGSTVSVPGLATSGFHVIELDDEGDVSNPHRLFAAFGGACDVLIVDSYAHRDHHESSWRAFARRIVVIDDLADRPHDCDLLVNQSVGLPQDLYRPLVPPRCRQLLGPDFALLRDEFAAARAASLARRSSAKGVDRIAISFGMTDSPGATVRALDELAAARVAAAVEIIIGPSPHLERIRWSAARHPFHTAVLVGRSDIAAVLASCDLCIGAGGSSSLERCCLGVPSVLVALADNQRHNARQLEMAGAVLDLGLLQDLAPGAIGRAVTELTSGPGAQNQLTSMSANAARLCDGGGASRVVAAIGLLVESSH